MRAFLFCLLWTPVFAFAAPSVVTQTVGQVADRVVTSREVQISAVLERILFPAKDAKPSIYEVKLTDANFMNEVTANLLEVVVVMEAENFSLAKVSEDIYQQSLKKVEKQVAGSSYWQSLEVSSQELKKFTEQKLIAKGFIKFKTSSMVGVITDNEALAYYEKNRIKFGAMPFASFKDNIKTYLAQQQLEERSRAWFEIIKRKYKVRNLMAETSASSKGTTK